jgi:hypothetical protein
VVRERLVLFFLVLVLGSEAPGCVLIIRLSAAFGTRFHYHLSRALQGARFFEASMPSLFHAVLPE